jgi:hypothetical protein
MTPEEKKKDAALRRTHGISLAQYEAILEAQGGCCPICFRVPDEGEYFTVDHDHGSKAQEIEPFVRGVICRGCNRFVIGRHRDGAKLMRAAEYLLYPPAQQVLPASHKYPQKKRQPRKRPRGKR